MDNGIEHVALEQDAVRRAAGLRLLAVAAVMLGVCLAATGLVPRGTHGGMAVTAVLCGLVGGWMAAGRLNYAEVDVRRRTILFVRNGRRGPVVPLDAVAPIEVVRRRHATRGSGRSGGRVSFDYAVRLQPPDVPDVVRVSGGPAYDLAAYATPQRARRRMEELARRWKLTSRSAGGSERTASELDVPLHVRLRDRPAAHAAERLPAGGAVSVRRDASGYTVVSTHQDRHELMLSGAVLLGCVLFALFVGRIGLDVAGDEEPARTVGYGVVGAMLLAAALVARTHVLYLRDALAPGEIRITPAGVSHRGRTIALAHVEEVTASGGIDILGDRHALAVPASFCPAELTPALARTVEDCIVDVGRRPTA